jgi:hypothetical protein
MQYGTFIGASYYEHADYIYIYIYIYILTARRPRIFFNFLRVRNIRCSLRAEALAALAASATPSRVVPASIISEHQCSEF